MQCSFQNSFQFSYKFFRNRFGGKQWSEFFFIFFFKYIILAYRNRAVSQLRDMGCRRRRRRSVVNLSRAQRFSRINLRIGGVVRYMKCRRRRDRGFFFTESLKNKINKLKNKKTDCGNLSTVTRRWVSAPREGARTSSIPQRWIARARAYAHRYI